MNELLNKMAPNFGHRWEPESSYHPLAKSLILEAVPVDNHIAYNLIQVAAFILGIFHEKDTDLRGLLIMQKPFNLMLSKFANIDYMHESEYQSIATNTDCFFSLLALHPKSRLMLRGPHQQDNVLKYFHYQASGLSKRSSVFPTQQYDKMALPIHARLRYRIHSQQSMSTLQGHELAARRTVLFMPNRQVEFIQDDPLNVPVNCIEAAFHVVEQGIIPEDQVDYARPLGLDSQAQVNRVVTLLASKAPIVRRWRFPGECPEGLSLLKKGHLGDRQTCTTTPKAKIDVTEDTLCERGENEDGDSWLLVEHLLRDGEDDPAPGLLCLGGPETLEMDYQTSQQKPTLPKGFIHTHDVAGYHFSWAGSPWGVPDIARTFHALERLATDLSVEGSLQQLRAYSQAALALTLFCGLSSEELLGLRLGQRSRMTLPCVLLDQGHLILQLPNRLFQPSPQMEENRLHPIADHLDVVAPPFAADRLRPLLARAKSGRLIFYDPQNTRIGLKEKDLAAFLHDHCNTVLDSSSRDSAAIRRSRPTIPRFRMAGLRLLTNQFGLAPLTWVHVSGTYLAAVGAKRYYIHAGVDEIQADHYKACLWMGRAIEHEMERLNAAPGTDHGPTDSGYHDLRPDPSEVPTLAQSNDSQGLPPNTVKVGLGSHRYYHDWVLREHLEGLYQALDFARAHGDTISLHNVYTVLAYRGAELAALLRPTNHSPQLTDFIETMPALCIRDKQSSQFHEERLVCLAGPAALFLSALKLQRKQLLASVAGRHNLLLALLDVPQHLFLMFASPDSYPVWNRRLLGDVMTQLGLPHADIFPNAFRHWASNALVEEGLEHSLGDYLRGHSSFGQEPFNPYSAFAFRHEARRAAQAVMDIATKRLGFRYVPYLH